MAVGDCRAMIIDDEAWIREGLSEYIEWEKLGIKLVKVVRDGDEALAYLEANRADIILSDIRMPNMTGLELVAHIRERQGKDASMGMPHIKVIFLSGYGDFKYAQEALRLGAVDYLLKPADVEEIEAALLKAKALCSTDSGSSSWTSAAEAVEQPSSYLIKKAIQYIQGHYAEDISLAQIAGELFVTPNYLSRLFRQETGQSFSEYVSRIRMDKACAMLVDSHMKIYQIGEAVGYPNPRYFSEWFQKNAGMSPGDYRNRNS